MSHAAKTDARALLVGVLASNILGATIVIAGLKAGITPGVSPIVLLLTWGILARSLRSENASQALNIAQVAGSAGALVAAGVIFTAPLLPILARSQGLSYEAIPVTHLIVACLIGSFLGFGWVGLNAGRLLADPSLPAPEAKACAQMVDVAVAQLRGTDSTSTTQRRALGEVTAALIPGALLGFLIPAFQAFGVMGSKVLLAARQSVDGVHAFRLELPVMPIYLGIGVLLSLPTALTAFGGAVVRLSGDFALATMGVDGALWPATSMRWVGGAAMTVAVVASLVRILPQRAPRPDATYAPNLDTLVLQAATRRRLWLAIGVGMICLVAGIFTYGGWSGFTATLALVLPIAVALLVMLGALLSLQIGSSSSPVSGTIFLMTLILCLLAAAFGRGRSTEDLQLLTVLLVACCVAVCASNDSSQDFKTLQLCNLPIERGFLGQFLGLLTASISVPFVYVLAERAYGVGSEALPAPQGQLFAMLAEGLLFDGAIPRLPLMVGALIGAIAVALEYWGKRRGLALPSMALAIGLYLPPYLGIGLVIGALARELGRRKSDEAARPVLLASGLITGAAAFDIAIGIALLAGFSPERLRFLDVPALLSTGVAAGGLALVCAAILRSARASD